MVEGEAKALILWVFIHPRKTWRPLPDTVQDFEIAPGEKDGIKTSLSPVVVKALSATGLRSWESGRPKTTGTRCRTCFYG